MEIKKIKTYDPISDSKRLSDRASEYAKYVDSLIRKKYSISAELAILRQRDTKPDEYASYNEYAEQCKMIAKKELAIL